jgi:hypothetical protein
MIVSIHQPQYLPWLGYFDKMNRSDVFVLLDDVQFKKNEWQNRNKIRTSQGWQWLTIPICHESQQLINRTKIMQRTSWDRQHLNAVTFNYKSAKYFDDYISIFELVYRKTWNNLSDLNYEFIIQIKKALGIKTGVKLSSELQITSQGTERLIDLCKALNADCYLSGQDGPKYMDMSLWEKSNIEVAIQNYDHPSYPQHWAKNENEFISNLSVIDLLFNCGPDSLSILSSQGVKR